MPVIPACWEAEAEELQIQAQNSHFDNLARLFLKINNTKKEMGATQNKDPEFNPTTGKKKLLLKFYVQIFF